MTLELNQKWHSNFNLLPRFFMSNVSLSLIYLQGYDMQAISGSSLLFEKPLFFSLFFFGFFLAIFFVNSRLSVKEYIGAPRGPQNPDKFNFQQ